MNKYDELLEKHLEENINYGANTIKNADRDDLEQLAADSYHYGWYDSLANGDKTKSEKSSHKYFVSDPLPDATKEMLKDIISWEKDLSEYESLEKILRKKYTISKTV